MVMLIGGQVVRLHRQTILGVYLPHTLLVCPERILKYLSEATRPNLPFRLAMVHQISVRHLRRESVVPHRL